MPCCPDLFDESFEWTDRSADHDCHVACNALGDKTNSYLDYCPGGSLENLPSFSNCPAARQSLAKVMRRDFCSNNKTLECKWKFKVYDNRTGAYLKIHGSFAYDETSNSDCIEACEALGDQSNLADEFCNKPTLTSRIDKCAEAKTSYDQVHPLWCSDGGMTLAKSLGRREVSSVMLKSKPQPITARALNHANSSIMPVKLASDEKLKMCTVAYASGCQSKEPFSTCCDHCSRSDQFHICAWSRTYRGQVIGQNLSTQKGGMPWGDCDYVCDELTDQTKPATWLCNKVELQKVFDRCPLALATFPKIPWCQSTVSLSATTEPSPGLDTALAAGGAILLLVTAIAMGVKFHSHSRHVEVDNRPMLG